MKKSFWVYLVLVLSVFAGGYFFVSTKHRVAYSPRSESMFSLPIHTLKNKSFMQQKTFIGTIQAVQSVDVVPYSAGFLKKVFVQSGDKVQKNQDLLELDLRIPLADLNQAKEDLEKAKADRENALTYYNRIRKTNIEAISSTELEQAKSNFDASDAEYLKARSALNQAQTLYEYALIKAPIDGWVGNIKATIGQYLSPQDSSPLNITAFSPVRIVFSVPMSQYAEVQNLADPILQVELSDGQKIEFKKIKMTKDNQIDKSTDSILFFVEVQNLNDVLIPNAYINVHLLKPQRGILVSKNWIKLTPDGPIAFVLKDHIIEKRKVQIGDTVDNEYWIVSGLDEGEDLITVPVLSGQIGQQANGVQQ